MFCTQYTSGVLSEVGVADPPSLVAPTLLGLFLIMDSGSCTKATGERCSNGEVTGVVVDGLIAVGIIGRYFGVSVGLRAGERVTPWGVVGEAWMAVRGMGKWMGVAPVTMGTSWIGAGETKERGGVESVKQGRNGRKRK